ncbi:MAG: FHA domain-containing protein [Thermoanaerobaculia bacterium]|nr:FHA domain-containing protein [Thermoanaerobaculia bacterium]
MSAKRKLILRHLTGSRSGDVEERAIDQAIEVELGRYPGVDIRFDDTDDLVSRQHARLSVVDGDPPSLEVTDLASSNGTFVNKQRLSSSMTVRPGDVLQLGAGGPELEIDLDPRPQAALGSTRMATAPAALTRAGATPPAPPVATSSEVGKATADGMISDTRKKSRRQLLTFAALLLAVGALVVLVVLFQGCGLPEEVGEAMHSGMRDSPRSDR